VTGPIGTPDTPSPGKRLPAWLVILLMVGLLGFLTFLAVGMKKTGNTRLVVGNPVPDFQVTSFSGETYRLSDLKGKVVLLNFWASWCLTCEDEAKALEEVWKEHKGSNGVVFIGIDYVDTDQEAQAYLKRFGITYPNGPDLRLKISQIFGVTGVPETFLIDQDGKLRDLRIGPFSSANEIREMLSPVIQD
jgi:cytochrome c biogenesis protein CcmG, thiol:disulfide interchange protein DsbE